MRLIFLGAPGVGKGTYSNFVKNEYSIPHISTGDLLRAEIVKDTPEGRIVKQIIDKGNLAPVEIVTAIMKKRISEPDCKNGYILDGYPRSLEQAELLIKEDIKIDKVLNFIAPTEVILQRLSGRRTCSKCAAVFHVKNIPPKVDGVCDKCGGQLMQRADETEEAVKQRLIVYEQQTKPLIEYYREKGMLVEIDANKLLDEIFKSIKAVLDKL